MVNELIYEEYNDIFNISNRIKSINIGYKLFRNKQKNKFEILNISKNNEICLSFDTFLINIEKELQKTKVENMRYIDEEIEEHNKKLQKKQVENIINEVVYNQGEKIG